MIVAIRKYSFTSHTNYINLYFPNVHTQTHVWYVESNISNILENKNSNKITKLFIVSFFLFRSFNAHAATYIMGKLLHTLAPLVTLPERNIVQVSKCMHDRFKIRSKERHTNPRSIAGFESTYRCLLFNLCYNDKR